jgi:type IV secretion system protein VirB1
MSWCLVGSEMCIRDSPFAIGVNGPYVVRPQPSSAQQGIATAYALLRTPGVRSIDIGLGMINSETLKRRGMTIEQAFEPCTNLATMQAVLLTSYQRWAAVHGPGDTALQKSLSEYNTGNSQSGFVNGYVRRIYMQPVK